MSNSLNFLRPQSFGFDIIVNGTLVARAVKAMAFGYWGYNIILPGGEAISRTFNAHYIGARVNQLIQDGRICVGDPYECNCNYCSDYLAEQQADEIAAENGYVRHLETQMDDEYRAFEAYEHSMGLS